MEHSKKLDLSISAADLERIERILDYHFSRPERVALALTHSSWANEHGLGQAHNERLEFLGDAVLELCISWELFTRFPQAREGDMTRVRSQLVGTTSYGHEVWANKIAMAADKLILTGGILVHHMAGFGGGRKDIIPGCARKDTILSNHKMVIDPNAQAGVLENNPVHLDFMEACAFTHPAYLLNVICDDHGMIYQAVAGHWREAYLHGAELAKDFYLYPLPERPDIVIASCGGFPKDIDLRQSKKGFYNASRAVKKGGVIICLAECPEGCSKEMDDPFEEWLGRYPDKDSVVAELKRKVNMGGLNCYKVRECQAHCRLILITALDQKRMAEVNVECYPKEQLNEVIRTVLAEYDHPKVLYMPQATLTLPLVKE